MASRRNGRTSPAYGESGHRSEEEALPGACPILTEAPFNIKNYLYVVLVKLQRLLDEGQFVASYKFALLLALADLSVESGDDTGGPLALSVEIIAEKFIQYYWRQAVPYPISVQARILQQNTGKQAAVLNIVRAARGECGDSMPAMLNRPSWKALVREVAAVVRVMPLWKLQTVGQERLDFLYENSGTGRAIELRAGVAYCFRKFHGLISDLVRGAWVRYVRQQNMDILGETADLNEFLFGSERAGLAAVRPVLMDIQHGACFYCGSPLKPTNTDVALRGMGAIPNRPRPQLRSCRPNL